MGFGSPLFSFASVKRGLEASLPSSCQQGALYSAYDEPALYIGNELNSFEDIVCRNKALNRSVAGLYACQTLLHENHPAGIESYNFHQIHSTLGNMGAKLGAGGYSNQTSPYSMRVISGATAGDGARVIVPYAFPSGGNLYEVSVLVHSVTVGTGNGYLFAGMAQGLNIFDPTQFQNWAGFYVTEDGISKCGIDCWGYQKIYTVSSALGRNVQAGDMLTVRLFRLEGSIDIDSVSFYVNGQRLFTMRGTALSYIPDAAMYPGFGAYARGLLSAEFAMTIRDCTVRYIP